MRLRREKVRLVGGTSGTWQGRGQEAGSGRALQAPHPGDLLLEAAEGPGLWLLPACTAGTPGPQGPSVGSSPALAAGGACWKGRSSTQVRPGPPEASWCGQIGPRGRPESSLGRGRREELCRVKCEAPALSVITEPPEE